MFRKFAAPSPRGALGALLAGLLVIGLAPLATADDGTYRWGNQPIGQFGVHGGWFKTRSADHGAALGGVHLELMPAPFLGIQGAVDFRNDERFDTMVNGVREQLNVRTIPITATGKLYLPIIPRFAPYAEFGAGWYRQEFDYSKSLELLGVHDRDITTFGWHTGLGANVQLAPKVGMFGEVRWIFLDPNQDLGSSFQDIRDFDFNSIHALGGLSLLF